MIHVVSGRIVAAAKGQASRLRLPTPFDFKYFLKPSQFRAAILTIVSLDSDHVRP